MMMTAPAAQGFTRFRAKPITSPSERGKVLCMIILGCLFSGTLAAGIPPVVGAQHVAAAPAQVPASANRNWYKTEFSKDATGKPITYDSLAPDLIRGIHERYTQLGQPDVQRNKWLDLPNYDSTGYYKMRGETPPIWKVFFDNAEKFTAFVLPPQSDYYKVEFLTFQEIDAKRKEALNAYWKKYGKAASAESPKINQYVSSGRHNWGKPDHDSYQYEPPQQIYEATARRPSSGVVWKVQFKHSEAVYERSDLIEQEYQRWKANGSDRLHSVWINNVTKVKGQDVGYRFCFYKPARQIGKFNVRDIKRYVNHSVNWDPRSC